MDSDLSLETVIFENADTVEYNPIVSDVSPASSRPSSQLPSLTFRRRDVPTRDQIAPYIEPPPYAGPSGILSNNLSMPRGLFLHHQPQDVSYTSTHINMFPQIMDVMPISPEIPEPPPSVQTVNRQTPKLRGLEKIKKKLKEMKKLKLNSEEYDRLDANAEKNLFERMQRHLKTFYRENKVYSPTLNEVINAKELINCMIHSYLEELEQQKKAAGGKKK